MNEKTDSAGKASRVRYFTLSQYALAITTR